MAEHRLFVYGSLKRDGRHHDHMGGARFVAEAETIDGHVLVAQGDYPALGRGEGRVRGELFLVSDALLAELDLFEDCPRLYRRAEITLSDGSRALAYWRPEDC